MIRMWRCSTIQAQVKNRIYGMNAACATASDTSKNGRIEILKKLQELDD
jgi:hypothetical protein